MNPKTVSSASSKKESHGASAENASGARLCQFGHAHNAAKNESSEAKKNFLDNAQETIPDGF